MFGLFKKGDKKDESSSNQHYFDLVVNNIIQETRETITIVFNQPTPPLEYKSGQFLTLIVPFAGKEVRRSYSLCSSPFLGELPAVTVKRVDNGKMSNWLADNLKKGG